MSVCLLVQNKVFGSSLSSIDWHKAHRILTMNTILLLEPRSLQYFVMYIYYKSSLCCRLLGALQRAEATASLVSGVSPGLQQRLGACGEVIGGHPDQGRVAIGVQSLDVNNNIKITIIQFIIITSMSAPASTSLGTLAWLARLMPAMCRGCAPPVNT